MRPILRLFDRYVLREVVPPFFIGLALTTFVLLMNQVLLLAELFINKGVPIGVVIRILGLLLPSLLVFALPMSVLMGILGGLARMSADSEIVAFRTLGIDTGRLVRPVFAFGLAVWVLTSALALEFAPRANYAWVQAMTNSVLARVRLKVSPLEFNESIPNMVFFVRNIRPDEVWEDVFVFLTREPKEPRAIMARQGTLRLDPEKKRATLELIDGTVHSGPVDEPDKYSLTSFERLEEDIDVGSLFASMTSEKRVREKDIGELLRDARGLRRELASAPGPPPAGSPSPTAAMAAADKRRELRAHGIEIHKKFALPFLCLLFVLLGIPLGVMTGTGGRTAGFSLSLGIVLLYYVLITAGEKLAMDGKIAPGLGMWGPDVLLLAAWAALSLRRGPETPATARLRFLLRRARRPAHGSPAAVSATASPSGKARPKLRFPNVLDRYVSRKYMAILGFVFGAFMAVSVIVAFFERLEVVLRHGKPLGLLLAHVWYRAPGLLAYVMPVAALTTALLTLGVLSRSNEITAMKASGIGLHRAVAPVILLAAAASGLSFLVQERLTPAANTKAEEAWDRINDLPPRKYSFINRHWILGRGKDRVYHYDYFDPSSATFGRLSVFDIDAERWALARRAFAVKAGLAGGSLSFRDGWFRDFTGDSTAPFLVRQSGEIPNAEERGYFLKEWKEPGQMTYRELRRYAAEVRGMGFKTSRLRVELGNKLALPLASLVMTLIAVPFAFSLGRKGTLVGVGLSIVVAMAFWGTVAAFRSLGIAGVLPPFLAAWGADLIFGLAGAVLVLRLRT